MTGLPGQVEEKILPSDQVGHRVGIPYIRDVYLHLGYNVGDVGTVAAIFRDHAIHKGDLGSFADQPPGQIGANKTKPAGDEGPFSGKGGFFMIYLQLASSDQKNPLESAFSPSG